jgi:hypothetical protein
MRMTIAHYQLYKRLRPFVQQCDQRLLQGEVRLAQPVEDWLKVGTEEWVTNFNEEVAMRLLNDNFMGLAMDA